MDEIPQHIKRQFLQGPLLTYWAWMIVSVAREKRFVNPF